MTPRIDWLRVTVYSALLVGLCGLATLVGLSLIHISEPTRPY